MSSNPLVGSLQQLNSLGKGLIGGHEPPTTEASSNRFFEARRAMAVLNLTCVVLGVFALAYVPILAGLGATSAAWTMACSVPLLSTVLLLTHLGFHRANRLLFFGGCAVLMGVLAAQVGRDAGMHALMFVFIAIPFAVCTLDEKLLLAFGIVAPLAVWGVSEATDYGLLASGELSSAGALLLNRISVPAGWVILLMLILSFKMNVHRQLKAVDEDNDALRRRELGVRTTKDHIVRVIDAMHDGVVVISVDETVRLFNARASEMFGYAEAEVLGRPLQDLFADGSERSRDVLDQLWFQGAVPPSELPCVTRDGQEISVLFSATVMRDQDGEVEAIVCLLRDHTEVQRSEAQQRLQLHALRAAASAMVIIDREGAIEWINPAFTAMTGYTSEEAVGRGSDLLQSGKQDKAFYRELWTTVLQGRLWRGELVNRRKSGELYDEEMTIAPLCDESGMVTHFVAIKDDITKRNKAHAAARALEMEVGRASGMAEVATGVLHNVGNVVNSVNISAGLCLSATERNSLGLLEGVVALLADHNTDSETLQSFLVEDRRGRRVVESLVVLAGQMRRELVQLTTELTSLRDRVRHIIAIVTTQQEYARSIAVLQAIELPRLIDKVVTLSQLGVIEVDRCLLFAGDVTVDQHKLTQILVNLLKNARQAMGDTPNAERRIVIRTAREDDDCIAISVTDTGMGIEPADLARVFNHGFTTKQEGHGFGLHFCANLATEMGGSLSAQSDGPGCGATFLLRLPMTQDAPREGQRQGGVP